MLGWEFPPHISGGLGTACHGLVHAMNRLNTDVIFMLPQTIEPLAAAEAGDSVQGRRAAQAVEFRRAAARAARVRMKVVPAVVPNPYGLTTPWPDVPLAAGTAPGRDVLRSGGASPAHLRVVGTGAPGGYDGDLLRKVQAYALRCARLAALEDFDVVHAHDWIAFPAGQAIAARRHKPLVVHVHATEFDRSGMHVQRAIYDIERQAMHAADRVVCVSQRTARMLIEGYGVPAQKISVVYNGIEADGHEPPAAAPRKQTKLVLFLGRLTMQKGPEYFLRAAVRVLERREDVRFLVAGWGDLGPHLLDLAMGMGLHNKMRFCGFLRGDDVDRAYRMADVYVMPSVSEPFGLVALEALRNGTPVVLSYSSGVAEVLHRGVLKADFWDVDRLASHILAVLRYPEVAQGLRREGAEELKSLTWDRAAAQCLTVYRSLVARSAAGTVGVN